MWPFVSNAQWEEYLRSQGYDPAVYGGAYEESYICEICQLALGDDPCVVLEPPAGAVIRRKFHIPCLVAHLLAHLDNPTDEISNYLSRKSVSS